MIGGPPCQGFSPLNMLGVGLERRTLWREYLRALRESDPTVFVMENVPELLRSGEYVAFQAAAEELGFTVEGRDPQRRRLRRPADAAPRDRDRQPSWASRRGPTRPTGRPDKCPPDGRAVEDVPLTRSQPRCRSKPTASDWHNPATRGR